MNEKRALRKRGFWAFVVVVENDVFGDDLVMILLARTIAQRCQALRSWLRVCMGSTQSSWNGTQSIYPARLGEWAAGAGLASLQDSSLGILCWVWRAAYVC